MPTSTGQLDTELRARRHAGESPLEKVGIFGKSARWRRHSFCTKLAEAGVPESTMLDMMGHVSPAMLGVIPT